MPELSDHTYEHEVLVLCVVAGLDTIAWNFLLWPQQYHVPNDVHAFVMCHTLPGFASIQST